MTTSYTPLYPSRPCSNVSSSPKISCAPHHPYLPHSFLGPGTYPPFNIPLFPSTVNLLRAGIMAGFSLDPQCQGWHTVGAQWMLFTGADTE